MDTDPNALVARVVLAAMAEQDVSEESLAESTGIPLRSLRSRLAAESAFTIAELAAIADRLGTRASSLLSLL